MYILYFSDILMTNAEHFLEEEQLVLRQRSEIGDQDGTYEQIAEDPGATSKTVFVNKSTNAVKPTLSSEENIIFIN